MASSPAYPEASPREAKVTDDQIHETFQFSTGLKKLVDPDHYYYQNRWKLRKKYYKLLFEDVLPERPNFPNRYLERILQHNVGTAWAIKGTSRSPRLRLLFQQLLEQKVFQEGQGIPFRQILIVDSCPLNAWYAEVVLRSALIDARTLHLALKPSERDTLVGEFNDPKSPLRVKPKKNRPRANRGQKATANPKDKEAAPGNEPKAQHTFYNAAGKIRKRANRVTQAHRYADGTFRHTFPDEGQILSHSARPQLVAHNLLWQDLITPSVDRQWNQKTYL